MILGLGNDLCDIRRIEQTLERFGERFKNRVFTEIEQAKSERRAERGGELCQALRRQGSVLPRALGTGIRMGTRWRDMGVVNLPSGKANYGVDRTVPGATSGHDPRQAWTPRHPPHPHG